MATRLNPTNFGYQNFYSAVLTGDITSGTLTIGLDTVPSPSAGILVIEPDSSTAREVILYTSKGASTITCPSDGRGYSSTTAAAHLTGSAVIMAPIDKWFTALASGELSTDPLRTELFADFVASGCIWSGDSYGSTRNASMTSGVIYVNGRRLTLAAVTARTFTASKDTYIDVSDTAGDGTGTITYTEVTNNATSPALSANNIRIGIIVTAAGSIAAAGSVNQGDPTAILPSVSGQNCSIVDTVGNVICRRDPFSKVIGYAQRTSSFDAGTNVITDVTNAVTTVIVPAGRRVKLTAMGNCYESGTVRQVILHIREGSTILQSGKQYPPAANNPCDCGSSVILMPTAGSHTYKLSIECTAGANVQVEGSTSQPVVLIVELV